MDVQRFIQLYPQLYHMAEVGTWESIKQRGLLSTTAVLDTLGITGAARDQYETEHRPEKMTVGLGARAIVLRDQKPMPPDRIVNALAGTGITPQQWYRFLNRKVFMWAKEERLLTLLGARAYKELEHDVLTIDTAKLVAKYREAISLCRMNSGNTFPWWHPRSFDDFKSISSYPAKASGDPAKAVVEVVVDYAVPDLAAYVVEVRRMKSGKVLANIPI